jgi:hypothetical protein
VPAVVSDVFNRPEFPAWDHLTLGLWLAVPSAALVLTVTLAVSMVPTPHQRLDRVQPVAALRRDRWAVLLVVAFTLVTDYAAGGDDWVFLACTTIGILALASASRWPAFVVARFWWSVADRSLPWQLMGFLHDAHKRGVLRRVGTAYQFRHIRIRDHLANSPAHQHPAAP